MLHRTLVCFLSAVIASATQLHVHLLSQSTLQERLRAGLVPASKRQEVVRQMFQSVDCQPEEQAVAHRSANVICTLPGDSDAVILVGGHFDFAERGAGIVDDWSGTALLPSLYESLKNERRHHTFRFIAFTGEEKGLVGSQSYVKSVGAEQLSKVKAFVNLECLGMASPKVWVHRSSPLLVHELAAVANATKIPVQEVDVEKVGDDDTHPFAAHHVPVISIHSLTQETWPVLHSFRDNLPAIHLSDYESAYQLAAYYLAYLDQQPVP